MALDNGDVHDAPTMELEPVDAEYIVAATAPDEPLGVVVESAEAVPALALGVSLSEDETEPTTPGSDRSDLS